MHITIIGTGYVGLVTGACLADLGNQVACVDVDQKKISDLEKGEMPIFEPGLSDLVGRNVKEKRLFFTADIKKALPQSEIVFICVGTPPKENGEADLQYVFQAAEDVGKNLDHYIVVANKSTVPVGTGQRVAKEIKKYYQGEFAVISNPEFLREGSAIADFKNPDRVVIGAEDGKAAEIMKKLYNDFTCPFVLTNLASAEMIKYASNAFLAAKISFINEIANICENVGADVGEVAYGMGLDKRIGGHFLKAGLGYAGSCFPKDVRALHQIAGRNGYPFQLLRSVIEVNNNQKWNFYAKIKKALGQINGKNIAVWGLAFKPETDDIRESIAIDLVNRLIEEEAKVRVFDPAAMGNAKLILDSGVYFGLDQYDALKDVDCLLIVTEWDEFKNPDFQKMKKLMKKPVIIDGRNVFGLGEMREAGFEYVSVGR